MSGAQLPEKLGFRLERNASTFAILLSLRLRAEERMMVEEFGDEYAAYSARTKRLIPGVW